MVIEKYSDEASQAKVALANSAFEHDEKMRELKQKIKKLSAKLESLGVKIKNPYHK